MMMTRPRSWNPTTSLVYCLVREESNMYTYEGMQMIVMIVVKRTFMQGYKIVKKQLKTKIIFFYMYI